MRSKSRGFSLVEMLIVGLLIAIASVFLARVFKNMSQGAAGTQKRLESRGALMQTAGTLQKFISSGDLRFFSWGTAPNPLNTRTVARAILPASKTCASLDIACPESTALVYAHYDRALSPAVTAICYVGAGPTGELIVDISRVEYGTASLSGQNLAVTASAATPGGLVNLVPGAGVAGQPILGLLSIPTVTLWRPIGGATPVGRPFNPATNDTNPSLGEPSCNQFVNAANVASLYRIPVTALQLTQFVDTSAMPSGAQIRGFLGEFPLRVTNVELRSFGTMPETPTEPVSAVINRCALNGTALTCPRGLQISTVPNVRSVRISAAYKDALIPDLPDIRYEYTGTGQAMTKNCALEGPTCKVLALSDFVTMPPHPIHLPGETIGALQSAGFSYFKQERIKRLRFTAQVRVNDTDREEVFDVVFP